MTSLFEDVGTGVNDDLNHIYLRRQGSMVVNAAPDGVLEHHNIEPMSINPTPSFSANGIAFLCRH